MTRQGLFDVFALSVDEFEQVHAASVLFHDHLNVVFVLENVQDFDNVRMVELTENGALEGNFTLCVLVIFYPAFFVDLGL